MEAREQWKTEEIARGGDGLDWLLLNCRRGDETFCIRYMAWWIEDLWTIALSSGTNLTLWAPLIPRMEGGGWWMGTLDFDGGSRGNAESLGR